MFGRWDTQGRLRRRSLTLKMRVCICAACYARTMHLRIHVRRIINLPCRGKLNHYLEAASKLRRCIFEVFYTLYVPRFSTHCADASSPSPSHLRIPPFAFRPLYSVTMILRTFGRSELRECFLFLRLERRFAEFSV